MSEYLKPCPFCGSDEIGYTIKGNGGRHSCTECLAAGPDVEGNPESKSFWVDMKAAWDDRKGSVKNG